MRSDRFARPLNRCWRRTGCSSNSLFWTIIPRIEPRHIVREAASQDIRVRLVESAPLPDGWCGKQFACHQLAQVAKHDLLLFLDADVRLGRDAIARLNAFLYQSHADLVSGLPWQETESFAERLVIPLIHFLLLGYLPLSAMRTFRHAAWAAGCGQLFLTRRGANTIAPADTLRFDIHCMTASPCRARFAEPDAGPISAMRPTSPTAACTAPAANFGQDCPRTLTKGSGSPVGIVPWTAILLGGQVLPWAMVASSTVAAGIVLLANYSMRLDAAWRFRQSWIGALLHPIGIVLLMAIQWSAPVRRMIGRPIGWKGRPAPQFNSATR